MVAVAGAARDAPDDLAARGRALRRTRAARIPRSRARGASDSRGRDSAGARSAPDPGSSPFSKSTARARDPPRPEGRDRRSRGRSAVSRRGCGGARARRRPSSARARRRAPRLPAHRSRRSRSRRGSAEDDRGRVRLELDLALRREPRADERGPDASHPSPGSVRRRKSSTARRSTTSGAITRAFGVSSSASHASPIAERLDVVRDHRLEVGGGVGTAHADELPRASCDP